jgi:hypothetical protein
MADCRIALPRQAPEAAEVDAALFFDFFDFEFFTADAPPGALGATVLAAAGTCASCSEAIAFGVGFVPGFDDDAFAPVGGANEPLKTATAHPVKIDSATAMQSISNFFSIANTSIKEE